MGRGRRTGLPGVEGQVVAIHGVDGAEIQVADDLAYGCIRRGSWGYVVTEGRRVGAKIGSVSKSEVVVSRKELPGAREGDVGVGGYAGRVETLFVMGSSLGVHRQLGVELLAQEPEAVAETGEVVGKVATV